MKFSAYEVAMAKGLVRLILPNISEREAYSKTEQSPENEVDPRNNSCVRSRILRASSGVLLLVNKMSSSIPIRFSNG
jgi:hypothetical protein